MAEEEAAHGGGIGGELKKIKGGKHGNLIMIGLTFAGLILAYLTYKHIKSASSTSTSTTATSGGACTDVNGNPGTLDAAGNCITSGGLSSGNPWSGSGGYTGGYGDSGASSTPAPVAPIAPSTPVTQSPLAPIAPSTPVTQSPPVTFSQPIGPVEKPKPVKKPTTPVKKKKAPVNKNAGNPPGTRAPTQNFGALSTHPGGVQHGATQRKVS